MQPDATTENTKRINRSLMGLRRNGGAAMALAVVAPLLNGVLLVCQAWLLAGAIGGAVESGKSLASLGPHIAGIAGLMAARALVGAVGEQSGAMAAERIKLALRQSLFAELLRARRGLERAPASGAIGAVFVEGVDALEGFFARYIPAMIGSAVLPLAFAVVLVPVDAVVAALFLLTAPLIPLFMALAGWGAQRATNHQAEAFARLSGHFSDRLRGIVTLKLFGRANDATREVYAASEDLRRRTSAVLAIAFLSSAILEFFAALGVAGVALYVGLTYLGFIGVNPSLTLTTGLFALLMAPEVYQPLRQLALHHHDRAAARSALAQIERLLPTDDAAPVAALDVERPANVRGLGGLCVENLTVGTGDDKVLDGVQLAVRPGERVAILGQSGVGKSTLLRTICGLVPHQGWVSLDGRDLSALPPAELRRRVHCLLQRPRIFHGTIADNIRIADPEAPAEAIAEAAWRAAVLDFACELPKGLDTLVGEGGAGLSGGQAQRVALARIFLGDPDILILDEPTAHLDRATERAVLDTLSHFSVGRTVVIATHSPAVAHWADRKLRLVEGVLLPTPVRHRPLEGIAR